MKFKYIDIIMLIYGINLLFIIVMSIIIVTKLT